MSLSHLLSSWLWPSRLPLIKALIIASCPLRTSRITSSSQDPFITPARSLFPWKPAQSQVTGIRIQRSVWVHYPSHQSPLPSEFCEGYKNIRGDGNRLIFIFMPTTGMDKRQSFLNVPPTHLSLQSPPSSWLLGSVITSFSPWHMDMGQGEESGEWSPLLTFSYL